MMSVLRYKGAADTAAAIISTALQEAGVDPRVHHYRLTETAQGEAWLFVCFDAPDFKGIEARLTPPVLSRIRASLSGHPVTVCRSHGLRLAVLLSSHR